MQRIANPTRHGSLPVALDPDDRVRSNFWDLTSLCPGDPEELRDPLRSIGKVVSDLGEPNQVAGGVPRLDGNLNPVVSGAVVVLSFDFARGGDRFSDLYRLCGICVAQTNGIAGPFH